jgi:VanZ family protein
MQPKKIIFLFRFSLLLAFIGGTVLATAKMDFPVVATINDKAAHIFAFFVLALLLDFSFPATGFHTRKVLSLLGYGLAIEIVQYFLPYRTFSLLDLAADGIGLFLYRAMIPLLRKLPLLKDRWARVYLLDS